MLSSAHAKKARIGVGFGDGPMGKDVRDREGLALWASCRFSLGGGALTPCDILGFNS